MKCVCVCVGRPISPFLPHKHTDTHTRLLVQAIYLCHDSLEHLDEIYDYMPCGSAVNNACVCVAGTSFQNAVQHLHTHIHTHTHSHSHRGISPSSLSGVRARDHASDPNRSICPRVRALSIMYNKTAISMSGRHSGRHAFACTLRVRRCACMCVIFRRCLPDNWPDIRWVLMASLQWCNANRMRTHAQLSHRIGGDKTRFCFFFLLDLADRATPKP